MYRPTLAIDAIGLDDPVAIEIALENMADVLMALVSINRRYIRHFPDRIPLIYASRVRYDRLDPDPNSSCGDDDWQDIITILEHPDHPLLADCFPRGTLLLRDDYELVPIEEIRVGDRIWGRDAWTTVEASVSKGLLPLDAAFLNNGSVVKLTPDHHFFVARCLRHPDRSLSRGYGCSCSVDERKIERVRFRDLQVNDVLIAPDRIPFGKTAMDPDVAYVEGLYVSEGWEQETRFAISGLDGKAKEEQKHEVERICDKLGLPTRWHRKYIAVNDRDWTQRLKKMGSHAPNKRILSLDLEERSAIETLRGVMADSNVYSGGNANGGWTFSTTSRLLAVQTRVLQKMMGRTCSVAYLTSEQHGGFGQNGIWRLGIRDPKVKSDKLLRVKRLERDVDEAPCYDIQTSDHYVYLPEHDVTVSNCEDLACWRVAELNERYGIAAVPYIRLYADRVFADGAMRPRHLYHIMVRWPEGLAEYPDTVFQDPETGAILEDPSKILGMQGDA